jgi:hypothetical protein
MAPRGPRRTVDAFAHIRPRSDGCSTLALCGVHADTGLRSASRYALGPGAARHTAALTSMSRRAGRVLVLDEVQHPAWRSPARPPTPIQLSGLMPDTAAVEDDFAIPRMEVGKQRRSRGRDNAE